MKRKQLESSALGKRREKKGKPTTDAEIDFSDIPELTDKQLSAARRVGRPKSDSSKQLIAVRISPKLLEDLRKIAKKKQRPYQTVLHELLEQAVKKAA